MADLADRIIDGIIVREGGATYTDRPEDRGGPTKFGITLGRLSRFLKRPATAQDVKALAEPTARLIYREDISAVHLDQVPDKLLLELLADSAANHGPARAIKFLQAALHVTEDGILGPTTLQTLQHSLWTQVFKDALAERIQFYGRLVTNDRRDVDHDGVTDAAEMAAGWFNRVSEFVRRCP